MVAIGQEVSASLTAVLKDCIQLQQKIENFLATKETSTHELDSCIKHLDLMKQSLDHAREALE